MSSGAASPRFVKTGQIEEVVRGLRVGKRDPDAKWEVQKTAVLVQ